MSKVFSAKRKKVNFEYEFLDGNVETLEVRSLSSKEQSEIAKIGRDNSEDITDGFKKVLKLQLASNDKKLIDKVIKEQYEEGDLIEFSNSLSALIREEKEKK